MPDKIRADHEAQLNKMQLLHERQLVNIDNALNKQLAGIGETFTNHLRNMQAGLEGPMGNLADKMVKASELVASASTDDAMRQDKREDDQVRRNLSVAILLKYIENARQSERSRDPMKAAEEAMRQADVLLSGLGCVPEGGGADGS